MYIFVCFMFAIALLWLMFLNPCSLLSFLGPLGPVLLPVLLLANKRRRKEKEKELLFINAFVVSSSTCCSSKQQAFMPTTLQSIRRESNGCFHSIPVPIYRVPFTWATAQCAHWWACSIGSEGSHMAGARIKDKIKCVLKSFYPDVIVLSHFFECVCMYIYIYISR